MPAARLFHWFLKHPFRGLVALGLVFVVLPVLFSRFLIAHASSGKVYSSISDTPKRKVGLVLGCSRYLSDGRTGNEFFRTRMLAAEALFKAEKVDFLLVSGDNGRTDYDEPSEMKAALIARGIPSDCIVCDYAGFSTLDSVVRAHKVFLEDSYTVISQEFQNRRAIYIGKKHQLSLIGFNAAEVEYGGYKTRLREQFARVKTVLDVNLLARKPRFFGPTIPIGSD